jgi:hypothetical protein
MIWIGLEHFVISFVAKGGLFPIMCNDMDTTQHSSDIYIQFRTDDFSTNRVQYRRKYDTAALRVPIWTIG